MNDIEKGFKNIIRVFSRSKKFTLSNKHLNKVLEKVLKKLEKRLRFSIRRGNALLKGIKPITLYIRQARGFKSTSPLFESGQLLNSLAIITAIRGRDKKYITFEVTAKNIKRKRPTRAKARYKGRSGRTITNRLLYRILRKNGFNFYKFLLRETKWVKKYIAEYMMKTYKRGVYTRTFR